MEKTCDQLPKHTSCFIVQFIVFLKAIWLSIWLPGTPPLQTSISIRPHPSTSPILPTLLPVTSLSPHPSDAVLDVRHMSALWVPCRSEPLVTPKSRSQTKYIIMCPCTYISNILSKQIVLVVLYLNGNINFTSCVVYSSGSMTKASPLLPGGQSEDSWMSECCNQKR